jgi:hypothetical protein
MSSAEFDPSNRLATDLRLRRLSHRHRSVLDLTTKYFCVNYLSHKIHLPHPPKKFTQSKATSIKYSHYYVSIPVSCVNFPTCKSQLFCAIVCCVTSGLRLCHVFLNSPVKARVLKKNRYEKCFAFVYYLHLKFIPGRIKRDNSINVLGSSCKVPLSKYWPHWIFSADFSRCPQHKIS